MISFLKSLWKQYKFNNLFFKTMSVVFTSIMILLIIFAILVFKFTSDNTKKEITIMAENDISSFKNDIDNLFNNVNSTINTLMQDELVNIAVSNSSPQQVIPEFDDKVINKIKEIKILFNYIDSIYIYSENFDKLYTNERKYNASSFKDNDWIAGCKNNTEDSIIYPRKVNNSYPYVITIIKKFKKNNSTGAVIINVDMKKISRIVDFGNENEVQRYIIDDQNRILCQEIMLDYLGNFDDLLSGLNTKPGENSINKNNIIMYKNSDKFKWRYVIVKSLNSLDKGRNSIIVIVIFFAVFSIVIVSVIAVYLNLKIYMPLYKLSISDNSMIVKEINTWRNSGETYRLAEKIIKELDTSKDIKSKMFEQFEKAERFKNYSLQLQINSHFIFNTLNVMNLMVAKEFGRGHAVVTTINNLSKFIRYIINVGENVVPLYKEIECINTYWEILKVRNEEIMKIQWAIDESLFNVNIPKMSFQPIVENAIFYGLIPSAKEKLLLKISGWVNEDNIIIEISDNGVGMTNEEIEEVRKRLVDDDIFYSKNLGLRNVHQRIKIYYGKDFGIEICSKKGEGTAVRIRIPYKELN